MEETKAPGFSPESKPTTNNSHLDLRFLQTYMFVSKKTALVFCNVSQAHTLEYADIFTLYFNLSKNVCADALTLDACYQFMHPHDAQHIRRLHSFARNFFNNLAQHHRSRYKFIAHCRLQGVDKQYQTYLIEVVVAANNTEGNIDKLLIKVMPFALPTDDFTAFGFVLNTSKMKVIPSPDAIQTKPYYLITPKEFKIAILLNQHYKQSEVAQQLFCSQHTIRNHCINMIKRTNMRNMNMLLIYLYHIGLL